MKVFGGKSTEKPLAVLRKHRLGFAVGVAFAIVCFLVINVVTKPFSTPQFCATRCHEMKAAYRSWELSAHYSNDKGVVAECIDCHLPPKDKFFTHLTYKAYVGVVDTVIHYLGGEYDREKMREKARAETPNYRCLKCHRSLLVKPASSAARLAHQAVLNPTEDHKPRCVECHNKLHEREKKIFSSD
jgi:nitrate/TMAO reductase-like tetraheme cytochrome c subunit